MKKKLIVLVLICVTLSISGQQSMFKALFMFNFAKYIEWPNTSSQNDFIIGVLGNDNIVAELNKLANTKKINNKTIVVKSVDSPNDLPEAHIFFIPPSKSSSIKEVISFFKGKPTLIISEIPGTCSLGSCINYTTQGGKMKYEINKNNITGQSLNVDQKLIALGIEVK